ncbi:MAG: hypothetical protein JWM06_2467 [Actinomycetia bacterium]|nr:hypothetical protein [Actinomycetes bacterium]
MRRVFGPRTVVEAAFLVAVPVAAAALGAGMWTIIAASAVAYLLIFVLEATLWREGASMPGRPRLRMPSRPVTPKRPAAPPAPEIESVVVRPRVDANVAPEAVPSPEPPVPPEPVAAPVPAPAPEPVPQPSLAEVTPPEHVRVLRAEPAQTPPPEPAPEPVAERAPLAAVPEPVLAAVAPEPVAAPSTVVPIGYGAGPRQWNLWDLERLTREHVGGDVAQDEERQFLLMYLREFADTQGLLPVDFDSLVRDSFGELVESR